MSDYYSDYSSDDVSQLYLNAAVLRARSYNDLREQQFGESIKKSDVCSSLRHIYVALFDYDAKNHAEISFSKGDLLEVWDDNEEAEWRKARNLISKCLGLVPSLYIAKNGSLLSKEWYFEQISSHEAEKLLCASNQNGTFMVRKSEHKHDCYSLNIKCKTSSQNTCVKNVKISGDKKNYSLFPGKTFNSLIQLIDFYSKNPDPRLMSALIKPCPKPIPHLWDLTHDHDEQWEIPKSELQLEHILGEGEFGEVHYGKWNKTIDVAVKRCKPEILTSKAILTELNIMKKCRHPKLVALYGVCTKDEPIYIVTEFMKYGDLSSYLKTNRDRINFDHMMYFALQVTEGMCFLEGFELVHRDLRARNIFITDNCIAKIANFGLARVMKNDTYQLRSNTKFAIKWTAPEAILDEKFSVKTDVWSFGILLYEIFTYGGDPYPGMSSIKVAEMVMNGEKMANPKDFRIPNAVYNLMLQCWEFDPKNRPTFNFLKNFYEFYPSNGERS